MSKNQIIFGDITTSTNVDFFGDPLDKQEEAATETTTVEEVKPDKVPLNLETEAKETEETETATGEDFFGDSLDSEKIKQAEDKADSKSGTVNYLARVKELVEQGIFRDFEELEELEELTEEEYEDIKQQQLEATREEIKTEVLSSLDAEEKEFIEFKKNGGNIEAYISSFMAKQRAEAIDISTDNGKKAAMFELYTKVEGLTAERAQKRIELFEKALELDEEAERADTVLKDIAARNHAKVIKEQEEYVKSIKKAEEDYKEGIKAKLKEAEVDTKKINSIIKNFTERDANGFTTIDRAYLSIRNNPEKAKFLNDVLLNYEEFEKSLVTKKVNDNTLKTMTKIKMKPRKTSSDVVENNGKKTMTLDL